MKQKKYEGHAGPAFRLDRRAVGLTLGLAYGLGLWTHTLHWRAGIREAGDIGFLTHWLRDASMSIALIALAVVVARGLWRQRGPLPVALATSTALALGVPFHAGLFGHAKHVGHAVSYSLPTSMLLELLLDLPLALGLSALLQATWTRRQVERATRTWGRRLTIGGTVLAMGATGLVSSPTVVAAASGSVCPTGAPVRSYDVRAIDVDMTLNRYGDHDPLGHMYVGGRSDVPGELAAQVAAVRAQEASKIVTPGIDEDPIQPLVFRANMGDCVQVNFTNSMSGSAVGMNIDGIAYETSADVVGNNGSGEAGVGQSRTYRWYVPNDKALEGTHYLNPGPGHRNLVDHGMFGALSVEPAGSTYLSMDDNTRTLATGWAAIIVPGHGKAFRENVQLLHEIGNESESVKNSTGNDLPRVDPVTESYRPGGRGINYRSEPFMNRLLPNPHEKAHSYGSATFGDPATVIPRGYLGDPTKFRIVHAGAEVFHIYHLHGGGDRWRYNPQGDPTWTDPNDPSLTAYGDTGLKKTPVEISNSDRVDAVSTGPGESFQAEIESGAGATQQAAGDFLFHCHIAEHYPSGMWGLWRVYDTLRPDLAPLPDRAALPAPVNSAELIGKTIAGSPDNVTLTKDNIDSWVSQLIPAQGVALGDQDATVWDWTVDRTNPDAPIYLGEPDQTTKIPPDFVAGVPGHLGTEKVDRYLAGGNRPEILFNPTNGRPAWPMLRPHSLRRPPFAPNLHTGTPWLGENANTSFAQTPTTVNPWANRNDALCTQQSTDADHLKQYNIVAVGLSLPVTTRLSDPLGMLFTLAEDKAALLSGQKESQPLAIRANVGDCIAITLTSEEKDSNVFGNFAKVEMHIHHVQFDPSGSDGTSVGYSYEHSIRPYTSDDTKLRVAATAGSSVITVDKVLPKYRPGVAFGIGLGTNSIEEAKIVSVDASAKTITLDRALTKDHAIGDGAGTEFIQYRWYADALLDNIFWHDHVDGIHGWGHGGVGMLVVEPALSTYTDPKTGSPIRSGTIADIHPAPGKSLAPNLVNGDFREMVIWTIDDTPVTDSTINMRAEPFADRGLDPSVRFSSYTNADPRTPLLRAYPGDDVVIRAIHVGPTLDSLRLDGHRFFVEKRSRNGVSEWTRVTDTLHAGVSERYTLILDGGAGGPSKQAGDYLYHNGIARRFRQGAWGLMRVLGQRASDLQPLNTNAAPGGTYVAPVTTPGQRPPALTDPGNPCPANAPQVPLAISAVDLPKSNVLAPKVRSGYVMSAAAAAAKKSGVLEPLVVHVNQGDCVVVTFKNEREVARASFDVSEVAKGAASSGVNVGFNQEQTVAVGQSRVYKLWADKLSIEAALVSDFGDNDSGKAGLYGSIVVAEPGATFFDPVSGAPTRAGATVDVKLPDGTGYRDATLIFADDDPQIGSDFMPYPKDVSGVPSINYRSAGRTADTFTANPATPVIRAYPGDPLRIHALTAAGSEQGHVLWIPGMSWNRDAYMPGSQEVSQQVIAPFQGIDAHIIGGAGGRDARTKDYFYGDSRRPFVEAGQWGLIRVAPDARCPVKPLPGRTCVGS